MQELSFTTELQPLVEITVNKLVFSKNVFRRCGHFYKPHTPGQIPPPLVGEPHVEGTLIPQAVFPWALSKKKTQTQSSYFGVYFLGLVLFTELLSTCRTMGKLFFGDTCHSLEIIMAGVAEVRGAKAEENSH